MKYVSGELFLLILSAEYVYHASSLKDLSTQFLK